MGGGAGGVDPLAGRPPPRIYIYYLLILLFLCYYFYVLLCIVFGILFIFVKKVGGLGNIR